MYFWNIKQLKKDLVDNKVSEQQQFCYYFITFVIVNFAYIPFFSHTIIDTYYYIIARAISLIGMLFLYHSNGGDQGKDFLLRVFALGWVIGIRWFVMILVPIMIVLIALLLHTGSFSGEITRYDVAVGNILYIVYLLLLGKHIKDVCMGHVDKKKAA